MMSAEAIGRSLETKFDADVKSDDDLAIVTTTESEIELDSWTCNFHMMRSLPNLIFYFTLSAIEIVNIKKNRNKFSMTPP